MSELNRLEHRFGWRVAEHARRDGPIWRVGEGRIEVDYPADDHASCMLVEAGSAWFRHRNALLDDLLSAGPRPRALWDVGAGNGFVARHLQDQGVDVVAVEPGRAGAMNAARRGVEAVICGRFEDLALPPGSLPAIGCFDVLEHLAEPAATLAEFHRVLEPGGLVAATVPAMPWLWSQADDIARHHRRYTRRALDRAFEEAGFVRVRSLYGMCSLALPLFLRRALPYALGRRQPDADLTESRMRELMPASPLVDRTLSLVLAGERAISKVAAPPLGTSIFGLFRKR